MMSIPFNRPFIVGKELYNIAQAVMQGHLSGNGPYTQKSQTWLEQTLGCHRALLTHSCTGALEMAAILSDIQPGDEVIMPSFTFVSTANAFVLRGGLPVFVDIRLDTLNIDDSKIEEAITDKTKAIVPVHYAGVACDMGRIMQIARDHGLIVIEDAAQGLLSSYQSSYLGTIGQLGSLSFHETKNIISGEGGALLINDPHLVDRAEIIWEKGTNRKQFFQGRVDKYTWVDVGSSFLPGELVSAFLYAQLEEAEKIIRRRHNICVAYARLLAPLAEAGRLRIPCFDQDTPNNGHIFYLLTTSLKERDDLIYFLRSKDIYAIFHYIPLHDSPAGLAYGRAHGHMVNTLEVSQRIVRLPVYYEMTDTEVEYVAEKVHDFYKIR